MTLSTMPEIAVNHQVAESEATKVTSAFTAEQAIGRFVEALGAKKPTPGGGAAAALAASLGVASGAMAAIYTTRKKDEESGTAEEARALAASLQKAAAQCLALADDDASAYTALQATWKKDSGHTEEEKARIAVDALNVPVTLMRLCCNEAAAVANFLRRCNPNIVSDAYVSLHLLAGAGRAAYQTALVNKPPQGIVEELRELLDELARLETQVLKN